MELEGSQPAEAVTTHSVFRCMGNVTDLLQYLLSLHFFLIVYNSAVFFFSENF